MGTRIGSIEFEIEEFSECHEPPYQIACHQRSGRLCTAFRYWRSKSWDVGGDSRATEDENKNLVQRFQACHAITREAIKDVELYDDIWQTFAVFLTIKTIGVQGDQRTHSNAVALGSATSQDAWLQIGMHISHRSSVPVDFISIGCRLIFPALPSKKALITGFATFDFICTKKDIVAQIVFASVAGDMILALAYALEVPHYGSKVGPQTMLKSRRPFRAFWMLVLSEPPLAIVFLVLSRHMVVVIHNSIRVI
ncbi:hypothetical protein R6Q57_020683 [Mikania cordata]